LFKSYNKEVVIEALVKTGVEKGNVIFSHSNVGFFGRPEGEFTQENICKTIFDAIFEVIGDSGTLIVPTFTYSFCNNQIFDIYNSPSKCGFFTEFIRKKSDAFRSEDPLISVAAIGAQAKALIRDVPENSYGEDSFFDRFYKIGGKICNFNFDAGSTFIHYIERKLGVPYRFDKTFFGQINSNKVLRESNATIFVRILEDGTEAKFEAFDQIATESNLYKRASIGRGFVGCISAESCFKIVENTLVSRPWFLTKAEQDNIVPKLK